MGFPVGYTEVLLPKLLLNALSLLSFIRRLILTFLRLFGLSDFLEPDIVWTDPDPDSSFPHHHYYYPYPPSAGPEQPVSLSSAASVSASLIREMLPVVKFADMADEGGETEPPVRCAICLYDFEGDEEIRRLRNCRHIFHRWCLDRWMDCDRRTCPLCRTALVPEEMQHAFNERLWAAADDVSTASSVTDFYGEFFPITNTL